MKPAREWLESLRGITADPAVKLVEGRGGEPTLQVGERLLHSRYRPREEAKRFIDSTGLRTDVPVLVVGLGLGYHVLELAARGFEIAVVEINPTVAKLALEGPMASSEVLLGVGDAREVTASSQFARFVARKARILVHPPSAQASPGFADAIAAEVSKIERSSRRVSVAVVGPLYGGSLPIAGYLERAFRRLGHRTKLIDNSSAFGLYDQLSSSLRDRGTSGGLAGDLMELTSQWSYERVMEFGAEICIVMAQAPVTPKFPQLLSSENVISAFWFVENWRHLSYWKDIAGHYDYFFHLQPGEFEEKLRDAGCARQAVVHTGCDPEIHRPVELSKDDRQAVACEISFAGAGYRNRQRLFSGLTDFDFKIWGVEWQAPELKSLLCRPDERFTPEWFAKIVSGSAINLNLHSSTTQAGVDPVCDTINPRVFEIAACGGFQLCDPCRGLDMFFDFESELPVYRDLGELREKITHYLAHPDERRAIAQGARDRALRDHTYDQRAQQMLAFIQEHGGEGMAKKGVRVQRSVGEVISRVGKDSELGKFLSTLDPDSLFSYENLVATLDATDADLSYPQQIFAYLRELRQGGEALLEGS